MSSRYDGLEQDAQLDFKYAGPIECDECLELFDPDATTMCKICEATVCIWCWDKHLEKHEVRYGEES
jgi:hypothetical protein